MARSAGELSKDRTRRVDDELLFPIGNLELTGTSANSRLGCLMTSSSIPLLGSQVTRARALFLQKRKNTKRDVNQAGFPPASHIPGNAFTPLGLLFCLVSSKG
jgi:hypothetical protein